MRGATGRKNGWVQVNQGLGQVPGMSYGGYKQSGIGREFSLEGKLDSFTPAQERDGEPGGVRLRQPADGASVVADGRYALAATLPSDV
jgi:hypothetical protein